MKKSKFTEVINRVCSEASIDGHLGRRSMPQNRQHGRRHFQLETKVFRFGNSGVATTAAARGREQPVQAGRREFNARQVNAPRGVKKKL